MSVPCLADKASLTLLYNNNNEVDFTPYVSFCKLIQRVFTKYIEEKKAAVYVQKIIRGFIWRNVLFGYFPMSDDIDFVSRIVTVLRPEWSLPSWRAYIEAGRIPPWRCSWSSLTPERAPWYQWGRFYDKWSVAFVFYKRPYLARRKLYFRTAIRYFWLERKIYVL